MSFEVGAGLPAGPGKLRTGAALALVLAAAAGALPAGAQSGPTETADAVTTADEAADEQQRTAEGQPENATERVYVLGRRVGSSMATMPDPEEAPQVVNVISAETMAEQGVASLEQALRNVPGITTQIGEGGVMSGDQFFIRGLSAKNDVFTDGLRDFGVYTRDSFNYGQVEVYKGPSGAAFGRGAAGGGINTSSKTPFLETSGSATVAAGDADYLRVTGDWNQVLGDGVAVRIAAMVHHNENTGRDHIYSDRWGVAPSIGFGLGGGTTATIAYLHQDEEKVPDYGIPTALAPDGISRPVSDFGVDPANFYGYEADIDETTVDTVTARLRHVVNDWLTLTSDLKYGYYQRYSQFTPVTCGGNSSPTCPAFLTDNDPATVPVGGVGGPGPYEQDTSGVQSLSTAQIAAPLFGLRSEMIVGLDASWQQNDRNQYNYASARAPKDLLDPPHTPNPTLSDTLNNIRDTTAKDVAVFVTERLWLNEQWSVSGGLRQQWYEVDQEQTSATATCRGLSGLACFSSTTEFLTPQAAVIWEPGPAQHYYISYSSSAKPPGVSVGNADTINDLSSQLSPEETENIEAGARIALFGDRLQLQGAVFQTTKENSKLYDENGDLAETSGDSQEVTGVEIGVAGMITDEWSMNANATFLDTETTFSETAANIGKPIAFTPEQAASLWTTYNFTGALTGLEVGGGVNYQSEVFLNAANSGVAPSYTTLDGLISYGWDRFRLSLNGYNLTDELYFAQVHGNRVTPGQGRAFIATLGMVY
ncbi:MAG TPA: TonB-dependent receptor [Hyphomonadaceae bacterium]|nr:TonB-dependent receptor [Hyphomonadaceae bacterium]